MKKIAIFKNVYMVVVESENVILSTLEREAVV